MILEQLKLNKSTKAILGVAKQLVWKHGIKRITVDEICREAEVSKMTFYRYFENKYELVKHLMKNQMERGINSYCDIMSRTISYEDKIRELLLFKQKESRELSMELLKDIYSNDSEFEDLRIYMRNYQDEFMALLRKDFEHAQRCGNIRSGLKIDFLIYMLNLINQQLADPNLLAMYSNAAELTDDLTSTFFYGILER